MGETSTWERLDAYRAKLAMKKWDGLRRERRIWKLDRVPQDDSSFLLAARFAQSARTAFVASADRSSAVRAAVRAFPPSLPNATAAGFFFFGLSVVTITMLGV